MITVTKTPTKTKVPSPITIEEAKPQLNIEDFDNDDEFINSLIEVAIEMVEDDCNADLLETTNVIELDLDTIGFALNWRIMQAPYKSLTSVEVYDGTNWTTIASSEYSVEPGFLYFDIEFTENHTAEKIRFTFKTGYATADIPKKLQQAVLVKTADLYNTERDSYNLNNVVENKAYPRLISKHIRTYW